MMRLAKGALALAVMTLFACSAFADEPPAYGGPSRARRAVAPRQVMRDYDVRPALVPDCWETFNATLLRCAPRAYVVPNDVVTLNQLDGMPTIVYKPYPYLFSW